MKTRVSLTFDRTYRKKMLVFPNVKINIGLYVTERRSDGYHNLESIFYPVPLSDVLETSGRSDDWRLHVSGNALIGATEDNLVLKAARLLSESYPVKASEIYLHKVIPSGAGLGGGSSDAAFMLMLLNNFHRLGISRDKLVEMAMQLGSDCGFFIRNAPSLVKGRGELMQDSQLDLSGWKIAVVHPGIHVSTPAAFKMITATPADFDLSRIAELPVAEWKEVIRNDFENAVFSAHPQVAAIKDLLYKKGAVYASMSGSGSAVYGLFRDDPAKLKLDFRNEFFWSGTL